MGYALLMIESLAWSLLLVALVLACVGRLRRRWLRIILAVPAPLVLLLIHFGLTSVAAQLQFSFHVGSWFYPMLALTISLLVGIACINYRGVSRVDAERSTCAAAHWPRGKLAIGLVAALALYGMTFWNLDLAARQQLAALRIEAGAVALSVAPPRIPDRENAAFVYQRAFEAMGHENEFDSSVSGGVDWDEASQKSWQGWWEKWDAAKKTLIDTHNPALRKLLARQAPALKLLRRAAGMPGCYFERDYGRLSVSMLIPELAPLGRGARLLALDAIVSAVDKNYVRSVEDINAMFRMAEQIGGDPLLVVEIVAIAVDRLAIESFEVVIANCPVPAGELAALKVSDNVSFRILLQRGLRAEEALRLATFDDVGSGRMEFSDISRETSHPQWFLNPLLSAAYRIFMLGDDLAAHRRYTTEMNQAAEMPYWQGQDHMRRLEQQVRNDPGGILTAMLLPAAGPFMEAATRADARHEIARLGLALYEYRASKGRFPAKLDDLAPEFIASVRLNPFDGKPIKLILDNGGVIVDSSIPELPQQADKMIPFEPKRREVKFMVPETKNAVNK